MDDIMEKNLRTFADGFMKQQSDYAELLEENKRLREENEQLKNKRIFSSDEYDLVTLTSTTPQWQLIRKV